jgi:hypothetical protein
MAASDNLHPDLFHASAHAFQVGDVVEPRSESGMAFATADVDEAKRYAKFAPIYPMRGTDRWGRTLPDEPTQGTLFGTVYNVETTGDTETSGKEVKSRQGFRVTGVHSFVPGNFGWKPKMLDY